MIRIVILDSVIVTDFIVNQITMKFVILMGTPLNPLKDPRVSPDPTLGTTALDRKAMFIKLICLSRAVNMWLTLQTKTSHRLYLLSLFYVVFPFTFRYVHRFTPS